MTLPATHSLAEVAEALGATERYVQQRCRLREWPHLRLARGEVRFTAEHYAAVLELIAEEPAAVESPRLSFAPRSRRRAS